MLTKSNALLEDGQEGRLVKASLQVCIDITECKTVFGIYLEGTYSTVSIHTCIRMLPACLRDDLPIDCLFRHLTSEPKKHLPLLNL